MKIRPPFGTGVSPAFPAAAPTQSSEPLKLFHENLSAMLTFYRKVPRDGLHQEHTAQMQQMLQWVTLALELALAGKTWHPPITL